MHFTFFPPQKVRAVNCNSRAQKLLLELFKKAVSKYAYIFFLADKYEYFVVTKVEFNQRNNKDSYIALKCFCHLK